MSYSHVAYIDEAGDEGFGKLKTTNRGGQSQWLLLGAAIVRQESDPLIPSWRDAILDRFPASKKQNLHFRDLKHDQKIVACQEIAQRPVFSCVTFSNKITIPGSPWAHTFKRPGYLYNFMTRWLLERVTTFCANDAVATGLPQGTLKVVFSRRGGTNYQAMRDYMELMRDGKERMQPTRSIRWDVLDPTTITVENHSKWAGLQIADTITSSFFAAVEPNFYGNYETSYSKLLRPTVLRTGESALNSGITPVPSFTNCGANDHQMEFFRSFGPQKK